MSQFISTEKLAIDIYQDINVSNEFFNPLDIFRKIKTFLSRIKESFYKHFKFPTALTSDRYFNSLRLSVYLGDTIPLPEINVEVPEGFSSTFPVAIYTQSQLYKFFNAPEFYKNIFNFFTELKQVLESTQDGVDIYPIVTKYIKKTDDDAVDKMNTFTQEVDDYFKATYRGFKSKRTAPLMEVFTDKESIKQSLKILTDMTGNYKYLTAILKPLISKIYVTLDKIINTLEKKPTLLTRENISQLYDVIVALSSATSSYGKLLGETQTIEHYFVSVMAILAKV